MQNTGSAESEARIRNSLTTLAIARAALARIDLARSHQDYPLQIVVAGPTQVGKSAMVNLLLQQVLAESSPQAGFTVHCQGFHMVSAESKRYAGSDHWATQYFGDLQHSAQPALDRQILQEYSLQETVASDAKFDGQIIWDTPDFDSIRSFDYRSTLVKAIALADLLVFVVSREKYADKTVWIMFELLAELSIPLVVVMNKTPASARSELQASFISKYQKSLPDQSTPPIVFVDEYTGDLWSSVAPSEVESVQRAVLDNVARQEPEQLTENTLGYFRHHWDDWISGVSSEHRLQRECDDLLERICNDIVERYRTEYMNSDRHKEVMRLALSELLVLLEIPGMAKPLGRIRSAVTWPVRTLLSSANKPSPVPQDDRNEERRLLDELGKHAIASLGASLSIRETGSDQTWWRERRAEVSSAQVEVEKKYDGALDNYQIMLQVEIDRAAQSLYQNLQEQPATLNGLRAARVTADAAAVVLAVKSGGLGAVDLVVAPAMLSLTTLLTEGALGKYMDRIQKQLTAYQEKQVRSVIDRKLRKPLAAVLMQHRDGSISEDRLETMTADLAAGRLFSATLET